MPSEQLDPYCLDDLRKLLQTGDELDRPRQWWLLEHCESIARANRALDAAQESHDRQLAEKEREMIALHSELADWLDANRRLEDKLGLANFKLNLKGQQAAPQPCQAAP